MALSTCKKTPSEKTPIFQKTPEGLVYRIPSLIYIEDSHTLLAFAEERTSPSDNHAKSLVSREGKVSADKTIEWSPLQRLESASLPGHRTMNPCPVYEKSSKTIFLFFICVENGISEQQQIITGKNAARLCCVTRKEGEQEWSAVNDLTEIVIGAEIAQWATFAVGPGHGIQLASGRLVIPAYRYPGTNRNPLSARPYAFYFYSDDMGKIWKLSQKIKEESGECEMAETVDDSGQTFLYCNARSKHKNYRLEAWGESEEVCFTESHLVPELVESWAGCQGSVVSLPVPESHAGSGTGSWLLFSHPTSTKGRLNLGIYLNKNPFQQSSWEQPLVLNPGPSGYSDLASCADYGFFACLVECGEERETEQIALLRFSLDDVLKAPGEEASRSHHCTLVK
ncbi:sialidase-3-like [Paramormyrops kingsleyae]|uniref:sialidase-3-like n=1 Tax=Paramormyrops kingsleyae TaxID=1676925 RepID=UPI003B96BA82